MVEIGSQRLLANGWTTYSLGDTDTVRALQYEAWNGHQSLRISECPHDITRNGVNSNHSSSSKSSPNQYTHLPQSDQKIDDILKADGFVPRLLQRYFELTAPGLGKESVKNRCSATCLHSRDHLTCSLENVYPLYCIVLVHLSPGAGPLLYPRQRLGRGLSLSRSDMLATNWQSGASALSNEIVDELNDRFNFILQSTPEGLMAEMDGPGAREVGDVTIIASDMLYSMPACANVTSCVPKRQLDQSLVSSILPNGKKQKTVDSGDTSSTESVVAVVADTMADKMNTCFQSSTLYTYTIYQPKSEALLPPTYILNSDSTNKIRFDPMALYEVLAAKSPTLREKLSPSDEWLDYNQK